MTSHDPDNTPERQEALDHAAGDHEAARLSGDTEAQCAALDSWNNASQPKNDGPSGTTLADLDYLTRTYGAYETQRALAAIERIENDNPGLMVHWRNASRYSYLSSAVDAAMRTGVLVLSGEMQIPLGCTFTDALALLTKISNACGYFITNDTKNQTLTIEGNDIVGALTLTWEKWDDRRGVLAITRITQVDAVTIPI